MSDENLSSAETMSSSLPDAVNYHNWVYSLFSKYLNAKVLEIGAGYGQYSAEIVKSASSFTCVDLDDEAVKNLNDILPENATAVQADLSAEKFSTITGSDFDFTICLNVLEHLQDDLRGAANIAATLKAGGQAFIFTPAFNSLYGPMDKMAGHVKRYTRTEMVSLAEKAGLKVKASAYFNPIGGAGWWFNAHFGKPQTLSDNNINSQIMFFDKYILPFSRIINPLFRPFFGQSVWVLAEKV